MAKFLQWNCHSIRHKKNELIHLINKFKPSVLAVQETWLKLGSHFRVSGFSCLRDDRADGYAGSAILVSRSITFSQLSLPAHSDAINAVAVRAFNYSILSVYLPDPNPSVLLDLKAIISSLPPPIIVLGDLNIHHTSWGSHFCDSNSSLLLDLCDELDLCIINDGSPTRRVSPSQNKKSAVDLTIVSPSLASLFSWAVLPSTHGSDHFPIVISSPDSSLSSSPPRPLLKYNISKADWPEFSSVLDQALTDIPPVDTENVLSVYSDFKNALLSAASRAIPLKNSYRNKIPSLPWWDSECTEACRSRKQAELLYSSLMTTENFINYKKAAARAARVLSTKKRSGWHRFCQSLSPASPPSLVWKNMRRFRGALSYENISSNDSADWFDLFCQKIAPPFVPNHNELPFLSSPTNSSDKFDAPFSWEEFEAVLEGLKDSSPGVDGIPYSFILNCSVSAKKILLSILNAIFLSGTLPEDWKTQLILPILKPGKPCNDHNSYRPIALSCTLAKILEHLVKNRLEWFVESRGILARSQFGFRKGLSTMDSLSIFTTDIQIALSKRESLVALFLDVSAAYDNVLLPVLRQKMLNLSFPVRLVNFISGLFSSRSVSFKYQNSFHPARSVWKGLPQGSVLSPLLYSIYTYDLELSVNSFCNILQYADDLALYFSCDDIMESSARLNSAIQYLYLWLDDHGLSISVEKSNVVVFSRSRSTPHISIFHNQQEFPVVDRARFLGVLLDSRMTGVHHINHIAKKCEKSINILRSLSGVWWGSHPYTQKLLYNALVRSHLDYGSFLLEPCNKSALNSWDKIQSKCLRIITGAMKSSPINALQVECCDPPLHLRRQYLSDRFFFKIVQSAFHPLVPKLHELADFISSGRYWLHKDPPCLFNSFRKYISLPCPVYQAKLFPLFETPYDAIVFQPTILLDLGIEKDSPSANSKLNQIISRQWSDWLIMYTDASKISDRGCVGAAVWIPKYSIILNFKCPSFASVFTGEAIAILEALSYILSHKLNKSVILSDSKSCLQAILSNQFRCKTKYPFILKIKELLFICHSQDIQVVLAWIPSHSGISGNETVDLWAKDATSSGSLDHFKVYSNDLIPVARQGMFTQWIFHWRRLSSSKGKHYADIQGSISPVPWFFKFRNACKRVTSTICRLRLGHACSPVHLAKLRIKDSSICECGLEEGTLDHIFFNCPKISSSLYDLLPPDIPRPSNFKTLLSYVNTPFVYILCDFINKNNIRL